MARLSDILHLQIIEQESTQINMLRDPSDSPLKDAMLNETDCSLSQFLERDNVIFKTKDMVVRFHRNMKDPQTIKWSGKDERDEETLFETIDKYQEQPQLLDPSLDTIISPILDAILNYACQSQVDYDVLIRSSYPLFRFLSRLAKTRNPKVMSKLLTHEVSHLEPILFLLEHACYHISVEQYWETRYVLFLWTAMICRTPFDLSTIDSLNSTTNLTLVQRLVRVSEDFVGVVGKEYDAACQLCMRLLTRQDLVSKELVPFIDKTIDLLLSRLDENDSKVSFKIRGELTVLCMLYKFAPRKQLLLVQNANKIHQVMTNPVVLSNSLLRKLSCKLSQRVSLCYVPPKHVTWRYQRVSRRLFEAFETKQETTSLAAQIKEPNEEEQVEVPEIVEESLQQLLTYLRDKDTVVRWMCAKGIARLSNRLAVELVDEIISSLVEMFQEDVDNYEETPLDANVMGASESTWHGSCLALAEMSRRGLLLPYHLTNVIPWIIRALTFDQKRGAHSVGSAVRDSAAYVCWSFARAYDADVLEPFAHQLSNALIVGSLTDREVNVRRACAAAFQEHVGRHGLFSHGIDVLTQADYFALGNRANVFLEVLPTIAKYNEYAPALLVHLSNVTLFHWDLEMRQLAAQSIGLVLASQPIESAASILESLYIQVIDSSSDLIYRSGGLFGLASIIHSIGPLFDSQKSKSCLPNQLNAVFQQICTLFDRLGSSALDSFGSEITRTACCRLITSLCSSTWIVTLPQADTALKTWWSFLETTIARAEESLQEEAATAIAALLQSSDSQAAETYLNWLLDMTQPTRDKFVRRGAALAIGKVPKFLVQSHFSSIVKALVQAAAVLNNDSLNDAETRRNAIQSLVMVTNTIGNDFLSHPDRHLVIDTYIQGMEDYSVDSRGDVGSWIREASVMATSRLFTILSQSQSTADLDTILTSKTRTDLIAHIARQAMDKIDRLRIFSGNILTTLICESSIPFEFQSVLKPRFQKRIDWMDVGAVFPLMTNLIRLAPFREQILLGVFFSMSCLIDGTVKAATSSFVEVMQSFETQNSTKNEDGFPSCHTDDVLETVLSLFQANSKRDRVTVPLLEFLEKCFNLGIFHEQCRPAVLSKLFECIKIEVVRTKSMKKLNPGLNLFHAYASFNDTETNSLLNQARKDARDQMIRFLSHPYPRIRRTASELLYLIFSTDVSLEDPELVGQIEEMLLSTAWETRPQTELKGFSQKLLSMVKTM